MRRYLIQLSKSFKELGLNKFAQKVEELSDFDEPWHKEIIEEFGEHPTSEDEYFEENFFRENTLADICEGIMAQEGFKHYSGAEDGGSLLGTGAFGSVYYGIYKGKEAAAKIVASTYGPGGYQESESEIWNKILDAKKQMSPEKAKHIPDIYYSNSGRYIEPIYHDVLYYDFIVMERLYPLDARVIEAITDPGTIPDPSGEGVATEYTKVLNLLKKDEEFLYRLLKHILSEMKKVDFVRGIGKISPEEMLKEYFNIKADSSLNEIAEHMSNFVFEKIKPDVQEYYGFNDQQLNVVFEDIKGEFVLGFNNLFSMKDMPSSFDEQFYSKNHTGELIESPGFNPVWEESPYTRGVFKMLRELLQDFGIAWDDLHIDNLMQDKDGNLKIIDVGLYGDGSNQFHGDLF